MKKPRLLRLGSIAVASLILISLLGEPLFPASAAPVLTIRPLTWNVIGLDSNDVNVGPNNFPVGARVCNTGPDPATNLTASFLWDTTPVHPCLGFPPSCMIGHRKGVAGSNLPPPR